MSALAELGIQLGPPILLGAMAFVTGTLVERSHYRSIRIRESRTRRMPTLNFRRPPDHWAVEDATLVTANVVISIDYFKRFLAALRAIAGGRVGAYESLMDRARREALLRMKERAAKGGFHAVVNVRLETSRLASSRRDGQGLAGVEILAFGTGVKRASTS